MKRRRRRRISLLALAILVAAAAVAVSPGRAAETPEQAANACLDKVSALMSQHRFIDAADQYVCAADELAKLPGGQERAARYRANAFLYRSWGVYTEKGITGPLGSANLDDALRLVAQSLPLWAAANFPVGGQLAEAWRLYLTGVKSGLAGQYAEARQLFDQARAQFADIGSRVPAVRELVDMLLGLAEDQTVFADIMNLMSNRDAYLTQGGEINRRLADLEKRATPAMRPYYESLAAEFRAMRQYDEAGARLEGWDYQDAARILADARQSLEAARRGASAIPLEQVKGTYGATLSGLGEAVEAERHHGLALAALLGSGDTAKAKGELIEGVEHYRAAQAAFETAGFPSGAIGAVESAYARLRERASAVAEAYGPTQAAIGVGKTFFALFFIALGALTWLRTRLAIGPRLTVWLTLVVAIIGAFGLRAPDILGALKSFPIPK
jgi:hypothetical protein